MSKDILYKELKKAVKRELHLMEEMEKFYTERASDCELTGYESALWQGRRMECADREKDLQEIITMMAELEVIGDID